MFSGSRAAAPGASGQVSPTVYPGGKVAGFDGLRGVAIALVVTQHLTPGNPLEGGVDMFLVLSGYLITTILIRECSATGGIRYRRFMYRRLLRLYPALITVVAATAIGLCVIGLAGFAVRQAAYALSYTFDLAISVAHVTIGPLGHTWSLSLEMQFYLTCPLLVLLLLRLHPRRRLWAMGAIAVAGVLGQILLYSGSDNFGPGARAGALLLGCLLAVALDVRHVRLSPLWLLAALAAFVTLTVLVDVTKSLGHVWVQPTVSVIAAVTVWVLATANDQHIGFLGNRVVVHIGLMSYGLFLWHFPLVYFVAHVGIDGWQRALVVVPLSLLLAELSRRYVENPFLRLKDRQVTVRRRSSRTDDPVTLRQPR